MGQKESKFQKAFEDIDSSGDGLVTFQEFRDYFDPDRDDVKELFEEDGVNPSEFYDAINTSDFLEADTNYTGRLTFQEFVSFMKNNPTAANFITKLAD